MGCRLVSALRDFKEEVTSVSGQAAQVTLPLPDDDFLRDYLQMAVLWGTEVMDVLSDIPAPEKSNRQRDTTGGNRSGDVSSHRLPGKPAKPVKLAKPVKVAMAKPVKLAKQAARHPSKQPKRQAAGLPAPGSRSGASGNAAKSAGGSLDSRQSAASGQGGAAPTRVRGSQETWNPNARASAAFSPRPLLRNDSVAHPSIAEAATRKRRYSQGGPSTSGP